MEYFLSHYTSRSIGLSTPGVWVCDAALVVFLAICAYTDGTRAKILNKVTFPAMLAGLIIHVAFGGTTALLWSLFGLLVGFAIQIIPWMLGLAKAGDVKLLMGVGALKGWTFCVCGFLYGAVAFGIISIPWLLRNGELRAVGRNLRSYFQLAIVTQSAPDAPKPVVEKKFVPWGVGLSVGFFIALVVEVVVGKPFWFSF